ncbi:hypothetical protein [Paracoccus thiocyanatus]|uniref:hypothetical protein n=1 Tax=Paracoccus thiocyanatus TaxID=34006 RepID=UPI00122CA676|nr:hypothetical protein [Paracoccus thiocyanatus]
MAEGAGGDVRRGETMVLSAGAAHLLWLAWRLLRDDGRSHGAVRQRRPRPASGPASWCRG